MFPVLNRVSTISWCSAMAALSVWSLFANSTAPRPANAAQKADAPTLPAALVTAIRAGDTALVQKHLEQTGIDARDQAGNTPLILAALYASADMVELLLKKGADPNAANNDGATALVRGAGDAAKVKLLLDAGARASVQTKRMHNTPLILAARKHGNADAVERLLRKGASPKDRNRRGVSPILAAAAGGDLESVRLLLAHGADVNDAPTAEGDDMIWSGFRTPLMWAAYRNDLPMMRFLIENKADPNRGTPFGTPLTQAAWHDSFEAAQLLLEHKARTDARDFALFTPLHWAAGTELPSPRLVELLIKHGADVNAGGGETIDSFVGVPQTPLLIAQRRGPTAVVAALRKAGAQDTSIEKAVTPPLRNVPDAVGSDVLVDRIARAVAALQISAAVSQKAFLKHASKQDCMSCHQQFLPMAAVGLARSRSVPIDATAAKLLIDDCLNNPTAFDEDRGQPVTHPEPVHSYGYEALGLRAANVPGGQVSVDAMVHHLAMTQAADGRWFNNLPRPPLQAGDVSATALAVQAIKHFGWEGRRGEFNAAVERGRKWLWTVQAETNEDAIYQLLGLSWAGEPAEKLGGLKTALLNRQRDDGGWSQLPTLSSDAYATGQALYALHQAAGVPVTDRAWQKGMRFLLATQHDDGTWLSVRRTFPFQPTIASGFPHGRDAWLSASATSWAAMALTLAVPPGAGNSATVTKIKTHVEPTPIPVAAQKIDFAQHIKPILERSCLACHSGKRPKSGYSVEARDRFLAGGASGDPAVVPGKSGQSPLYQHASGQTAGLEMPPLGQRERFPALSKDELQTLRAWIDQGASWPKGIELKPK